MIGTDVHPVDMTGLRLREINHFFFFADLDSIQVLAFSPSPKESLEDLPAAVRFFLGRPFPRNLALWMTISKKTNSASYGIYTLTFEWLLLCRLRLRQTSSIREVYKCFVDRGMIRFSLDTRLQVLGPLNAASKPCFPGAGVGD